MLPKFLRPVRPLLEVPQTALKLRLFTSKDGLLVRSNLGVGMLALMLVEWVAWLKVWLSQWMGKMGNYN